MIDAHSSERYNQCVKRSELTGCHTDEEEEKLYFHRRREYHER